ncbi:unnamed protein product [Prorocentrum cordatum]|uniref:FLZ-type domain-containing protein n=1 Tax=Prorocentrum cordatum TaxID=2364126 RepID=A0ABN9UH25_9DINO|nr:unnamed protein product [Polarella glacialis]
MAAAAPAGEAPAQCRGRAADRRETPAAGPAQEVERKHVANCSCCSRAIVDHEPLYMRKDEIYCSGACRNMAAHVLGPAELRAEREERAQRVRDRRAPEAHGPPRPRGWRAAAPHESPRTTAAATTTRTPSRHQSKDEHCKGGQDGSRKKFWKRLLGSVIDIVYSVISGGLVRRGRPAGARMPGRAARRRGLAGRLPGAEGRRGMPSEGPHRHHAPQPHQPQPVVAALLPPGREAAGRSGRTAPRRGSVRLAPLQPRLSDRGSPPSCGGLGLGCPDGDARRLGRLGRAAPAGRIQASQMRRWWRSSHVSKALRRPASCLLNAARTPEWV